MYIIWIKIKRATLLTRHLEGVMCKLSHATLHARKLACGLNDAEAPSEATKMHHT